MGSELTGIQRDEAIEQMVNVMRGGAHSIEWTVGLSLEQGLRRALSGFLQGAGQVRHQVVQLVDEDGGTTRRPVLGHGQVQRGDGLL